PEPTGTWFQTRSPKTKLAPSTVKPSSATMMSLKASKIRSPIGGLRMNSPNANWSVSPQITTRHGIMRRSTLSAHAAASNTTSPMTDRRRWYQGVCTSAQARSRASAAVCGGAGATASVSAAGSPGATAEAVVSGTAAPAGAASWAPTRAAAMPATRSRAATAQSPRIPRRGMDNLIRGPLPVAWIRFRSTIRSGLGREMPGPVHHRVELRNHVAAGSRDLDPAGGPDPGGARGDHPQRILARADPARCLDPHGRAHRQAEQRDGFRGRAAGRMEAGGRLHVLGARLPAEHRRPYDLHGLEGRRLEDHLDRRAARRSLHHGADIRLHGRPVRFLDLAEG